MTDYWLSFRIHQNQTYERRYNALTQEVQKRTSLHWAETTSFFLARTTLDIDQFGAVLKAAIDPTVDFILMRELSKDSSRYIGRLQDQDLLKFLPNIKKL